MKNDVFKRHGAHFAGNYTKQNEKSQGLAYWSDDEGSHVIWFTLEDRLWRISDKKNLGTTTCGLYSIGDMLTCPYTVSMEWKYASDVKWLDLDAGNDLRVSPYSGGTH